MKTEEDCHPSERYLAADQILTEQAIRRTKEHVIRTFVDREKDGYYTNFIDWDKRENQIVLFTLYAYADLEIPKSFDCIFDLNNPNKFTNCKLRLVQTITEGTFPSGIIDHGYKHISVFEFEKGIPKLITSLHNSELLENRSVGVSLQLGICNSVDFGSIKLSIEKYLSIREQKEN